MHDNNEIHGNIKPKNIKILIPAKSGKIHAELIPPKNAGGALCWKSPEAIEVLNICDEYKRKKEDDIFSMGCIIYYVLTNGKHPFLFKHVNILEAKADYSGLLGDRNKIYLDLIKSMLSKNKTDRPLISHVINHPIFWNSKKTKEFYVDIKPIFTAKTSPNINIVDFVSIRDNIITKLESKKNEIFGTNWLLKLCQKVQDFENSRMKKKADGYQFRIRDPTSYIHLLNYIADKARHWDQWPLEIKPNQSYIEYHSKKFPLLLIYTYNELKPLKSISEIQKYYL
jgi:serine/threonine protein kinase